MKTKIDARTLENQIREVPGNQYCTYADVQKATGLSYWQAQKILSHALVPMAKTKPRRYLARYAAQVLAGDRA